MVTLPSFPGAGYKIAKMWVSSGFFKIEDMMWRVFLGGMATGYRCVIAQDNSVCKERLHLELFIQLSYEACYLGLGQVEAEAEAEM